MYAQNAPKKPVAKESLYYIMYLTKNIYRSSKKLLLVEIFFMILE